MIDWITCSFPYRGDAIMQQFLRRDWQTGAILPAYSKGVDVEGSYSTKLRVSANGTRMTISGNPVKFLTGQNVTGPNDPLELLRATYRKLVQLLGIPECMIAARALRDGDVTFTRVDCTFGYHVGTDEDVNVWLAAMGVCCHVRNRGRGHFRPGMYSVYYGLNVRDGEPVKGSRHSTFKFYNKARELAVHPMTCSPQHAAELSQMAQGIARGEATFRGQALAQLVYNDDGKIVRSDNPGTHALNIAANWRETTAYDLHHHWVAQMEISEMAELAPEDEKQIPRKLLATYKLWKSGEIMADILPRTTFWRNRKALMEYGIDIGLSPREATTAAPVVVPVLRVLEAKPIEEREELFWRMVA